MTMLWAEMNVPSGAAAIVGITNVSSVTAYGSAGKVGTSIGTPLVDGAHSLQYDLIESCDAVACQGVTTKRVYNSSRRAAQAAQTRADVLAAAVECFSESGWSGTTLNAIAERAGVAVETVYNGFGNKKQLLREAMDVAVVGDAEPIPLVDRPERAEMQRGTRAERVAKGVALNAEIQARPARARSARIDAARTGAAIAAFRDEGAGRRALDLKRGLELIVRKPVDGPVLDVLFVLFGPEAYLVLTDGRGLTRAQYEAVLAETALKLVG